MQSKLINKYIWLIDLVLRRVNISFKEINDEWLRSVLSEGKPISIRTFHNYRKAIEENFNFEIICHKGSNTYYINNTDDFKNNETSQWLLNSISLNNMMNESRNLKNRIQLEHIPSAQSHLTTIIEAMISNTKLNVTYQSFESEKQIRIEIAPYVIKLFRQRWYVIAKSDLVRIYALDRIKDLSLSTRKFKITDKFDPEYYFANSFGIIADDRIKPKIIKLRFDPYQANYTRNLPLHHSQKEIGTTEKGCDFEYFIQPTYDLVQEILKHGNKVEVLSPISFRREIAQIIAETHKKYIDD